MSKLAPAVLVVSDRRRLVDLSGAQRRELRRPARPTSAALCAQPAWHALRLLSSTGPRLPPFHLSAVRGGGVPLTFRFWVPGLAAGHHGGALRRGASSQRLLGVIGGIHAAMPVDGGHLARSRCAPMFITARSYVVLVLLILLAVPIGGGSPGCWWGRRPGSKLDAGVARLYFLGCGAGRRRPSPSSCSPRPSRVLAGGPEGAGAYLHRTPR